MTAALQALQFDAPLANPSPTGLYAATVWEDVAGPSRFVGAGVTIRPHNYDGDTQFGVWDADWCASLDDLGPDDLKDGERLVPTMDSFEAMVVWAYDQCDLTSPSQAEVRTRAQQVLRLHEQTAVETEFATRMLTDVAASPSVADIVAAVSALEVELAKTNTLGLIHASPAWAAYAAEAQLLVRSGTTLKTPLGHTWVFGGGYAEVLDDQLVASSPTYGWRDEVALRTTIKQEWNQFVAIAERAVLVGYEAVIAAVTIT